MDIYGLIGFPLAHSFSSRFFNEKFQREGIEAEYLNFEMEDIRELESILLSTPGLKGLNVTIPHKENVIPFLCEVTPEASKIGAVNAIRVEREHMLIGHNTDYVGFRDSIAPLLKPGIHRKALVLGTGGASKAVVHALTDLGIDWKYVSRASAEGRFSYPELTPEVLSEYTVVVNASPVGTYPRHDQCPDIAYEYLGADHLLYDLVYNPEETLFLKKGNERGALVKNGRPHRQGTHGGYVLSRA